MNKQLKTIDVLESPNESHELKAVYYNFGHYYRIDSFFWRDGKAVSRVKDCLELDEAFDAFDRLRSKKIFTSVNRADK